LAEGFSFFEARDLQNLDIGQAVCRVERSDSDFNLSVPLPEEPTEANAQQRRQEVITASRQKYATPRADVEAMLAKRAEPAALPLAAAEPPPTIPRPSEAAKASEVPKAAVSEVRPTRVAAPALPKQPDKPEPTSSGKENVAPPTETMV